MGKPAVKERRPEAAPAAVDTGTCRHHWIIESPRGALSNGRCKICGEGRQVRRPALRTARGRRVGGGLWRGKGGGGPGGARALSPPPSSAYNRSGVNLSL